MSGITLQQAEEQLSAWLAASLAVAEGQSYSIGGRSLTRANAREVITNIAWWNAKVKRLQSGDGIRVYGVTPG